MKNKDAERPLTCGKVRGFADAFIDDELPAGIQSRVLRHLAWCWDCVARIDELVRLKRLVQASASRITVPLRLEQGIRARTGF